MKPSSFWLAFFLAASVFACSSKNEDTDSTNEGGNGGGGGDQVDAGPGDDGGDDADVPEAGPDGAGGAGGDAGPSETCGTGAPVCQDVEPGFDEDEPGFFASFDLGVTLMMGQRFGFVAAFFEPAAREDWCKEEASSIPLGTCIEVDPKDSPAPQCSSDDQCSPDQKCVPRKNNGSAIPCSEHCETPRSPMDIGPLEVSGFATGPMTFVADPQQSNGYIAQGNNGTIPASSFAFDTTYEFGGEGDSEQGIGAFQGQVELGPELLLTSPPLEDGSGPFPLPAIAVDPEQDLVLAWSGSVDGGEVSLELTSADMGGTRGHIKCRVSDTGTFTIPKEKVKALDLGDTAFFNNLNLERIVKGTVSGEGIARGQVTARQTLLVNMEKK